MYKKNEQISILISNISMVHEEHDSLPPMSECDCKNAMPTTLRTAAATYTNKKREKRTKEKNINALFWREIWFFKEVVSS